MRLIILILLFTFLSANELKNSTSPYLLQHKDNPINWMEWSDKAFDKAKKEQKFIFLSIGYSTCHWCHVMAKESFSKKEVADILNRYFVSIKVDKERLPYVDSYYQLGYRLTNNRAGGWPLNVVLLPNKKPIFFATYLPKDALLEVLNQIVHTKKETLENVADAIDLALKKEQNSSATYSHLPNNLLLKALNGYKRVFDKKYYGFSKAPKFPEASSIDMLLTIYELSKNKEALDMAEKILTAMAKGGIYDQIEGGFFRYSVDRKWQIPHFEKMLYTNAELITLYSRAYKITKKALYAKVVRESIANIERYFNYKGLYFSASNADSKDEDEIEREGFYYVFEYERAKEYLLKRGFAKDRVDDALEYFGIKSMGNFEGGDYSNATLNGEINRFRDIKEALVKLRKTKEYPFIDKKINSAWNALYIKALFDAKVVDKKFTKMAIDRLNTLLSLMYKDNILYHQTLLPNRPTQGGLLEDYAFVADALFLAYETTLQKDYLKLYNKIVKKGVKLFYKNGNWYLNNSKDLKVKASFLDSSYKSVASAMVENLIKYSLINQDYNLLKIATKSIESNSLYLANAPEYYPTLLNSFLMLNKNIFLIKGKRRALKDIDFSDILYPYIYKKALNLSWFEICGLKSCYKSIKDVKAIKKELTRLIKR